MFVLTKFQSTINYIKTISKHKPLIIPILKIHNSNAKDCINLNFKQDTLQFPFVWLRDNCQCSNCFHESAKSRIVDWSKFNVNVKPKSVTETDDIVNITWDDNHVSEYKKEWLKLRSFTENNQKNYNDNVYRPKKITWDGKDFTEICSKHDYKEILSSDEALYNWLEKISIYGVALIKNTPNSDTAIDDVIKKIGFTKRTHYGIKFIVQSVANTSNVAYLNSNLQMHTDLPYYDYMPGVNMLHCLVQTSSPGGYNLLSDCHFVANYMKQHHPEQYKLLTEIEVEWSDIGIEDGLEFFKLLRSPVINVSKGGEITKICFSIPQRGSHFPCNIDSVKAWYKSHSLFYELSHKFAAKFKTEAGDILVFDNIRLLHGRQAYEDKSGNVRKLIGAYVDWDEIYSRLRCLKVKLQKVNGI